MSADWKPIVISKKPAPEPEPVPAVVKEAPQMIVMPSTDGPRPKQWEFIPERDGNDLIVRIVATPIF